MSLLIGTELIFEAHQSLKMGRIYFHLVILHINRCFSFVGNRQKGKQSLSIGKNCDRLATVEHEFLHALGFWHEQSRSDRDDYVTIMWDQIENGKEHNFKTYNDTVSSALGIAYDYSSIMHYSKTSFNKGTEPTIVTKIPEFMDVIGQRMEFSFSDVVKLNKLYNCTKFSTFLDSCSFEEPNICGMIHGEEVKAKWLRKRSVEGGPKTDYTNMGQCNDAGFFMHFSTVIGSHGDKSYLESRLFYPKRSFQCLQFYLYNSGSDDDQLNVWVREYSTENPKGVLRYIQEINGGFRSSWELHHVTLDASQKFRVVFEGVKGVRPSGGGLALDDINLSETHCPQHTWHIRNFSHLLSTTPPGSKIYSPRFLAPDGYSFQMSLYVNGKKGSPGSMAVSLYLTSGPHDSQLKWPCPWRQATIVLMDQNPHLQHRMDNQRMFTTDPNKTSTDSQGNVEFFWDDPQKVGSLVNCPDNTSFYRGHSMGTSSFITHSHLRSRDFIKADNAVFLLSLEDVTSLLDTQPIPRSGGDCGEGCQERSSSPAKSTPAFSPNLTVMVVVLGFVGAVMLLFVVTAVLYNVRRHRKTDVEGIVGVMEI